MIRVTPGCSRSGVARDTATIVIPARGAVHAAGCESRASGHPVRSGLAIARRIAPRDSAPPTIRPAAAPASVRRGHQIPSSSSGQNVAAATVKASATAWAKGSELARTPSTRGTRTAATAAIRNDRIGSRTRLLTTSWDSTPATVTVSPVAVARNAAAAPALTRAVVSWPSGPPSRAWGRSRTTASVCPVSSSSGV